MSNNPLKETTGFTILAVDTSSTLSSYAILRDGGILSSLSSSAFIPHSKTFFSNLSTLLKLADLPIDGIDAFAAITGPGSFTGLRVGLAAIKGLAHSLGKPAIGINAIDAAALGSRASGTVLAMIEAGRGEAYIGMREVTLDGSIESKLRDMVGAPAKILPEIFAAVDSASITIVGPGATKYVQEIDRFRDSKSLSIRAEGDLPAIVAARRAARLLNAGELQEIHAYYVRPSDAELKAKS